MAGVARHKDLILPSSDFYAAAATGDLPHFSWVMPGRDPRNGGANSDHPCNDVALGERLLKDVYEALRAGPGWEKTLLFVVYDDAGVTAPPILTPALLHGPRPHRSLHPYPRRPLPARLLLRPHRSARRRPVG